jgi:hypothetical protein
MKGKELLETYPKIAKLIRDWFTAKMTENMASADDVPEEFKQTMMKMGVSDDMLINIIDKNPSALFEIFDSLQVYIGIVISQLPVTEKVIFNYYVCPRGKCLDETPEDFFNRRDAEYNAMLAAIEYINSNITLEN